MLYLFLPPKALLYEVFPHRYYKHGYKRAALEWGVSHGMTLSPPRSAASRIISARVHNRRMHVHVLLKAYLARKGDRYWSPGTFQSIVRAVRAEERGGADARRIEEDAPEGLKNTARAESPPRGVRGDHSCQRTRRARRTAKERTTRTRGAASYA